MQRRNRMWRKRDIVLLWWRNKPMSIFFELLLLRRSTMSRTGLSFYHPGAECSPLVAVIGLKTRERSITGRLTACMFCVESGQCTLSTKTGRSCNETSIPRQMDAPLHLPHRFLCWEATVSWRPLLQEKVHFDTRGIKCNCTRVLNWWQETSINFTVFGVEIESNLHADVNGFTMQQCITDNGLCSWILLFR